MKRKFGLLLVSAVLVGLMSNSSALAGLDLGNDAWVWSGVGYSNEFSFDESLGTFYLANLSGNEIPLLQGTSTSVSAFDVAWVTSKSAYQANISYNTTSTSGISTAFDLGQTPEFTFRFESGVATTYDLVQMNNLPSSSVSSVLTNYALIYDNRVVTFNTKASPVPIPASALLLGSGLLGLLGIGSRKKKA